MRSKALLLGSFIALLAVPAMAQGNNAINLVGTVDKVDASSITVKMEESTETVKIAPNVLYLQNKPAKLSDIKANDFVASAGVRKADGKLHSTELRIFPEAMRGVGEGQRPMNDANNQTMTNATVTGTVLVGGSNNMKVKFPGGESDLILDPGVPVFAITPIDKGMVKAGAKVRVQGVKTADGAVANRITLQ
jgi:hypothetical protein